MKRILVALPSLGALAMSTATGAGAETYRLSMWNGPNEPTVIANQFFVEEIERATNGEISFEMFTGAAILPANSHLQGTGDGVVQVGQVTVGYTPKELPLSSSISGFGFIENDPIAIGAAYADWAMHDPAVLGEFKSHNILPMAGFATSEYSLMCNTSQAITEAEQFKGLKVRAYGLTNSLVQFMGGIPVGVSAAEAYQALQTGALDCASLSANWLRDGNLQEVTKWTTLTAWAPAFSSPQLSVNMDFWQSLTDEQRAVFLETAAKTEARAHMLYAAAASTALDDAVASGRTSVAEPGESLNQAVADWIDAGVGDMVGVARDTYGIKDPEAVFSSFEPYVEKWGALVRSMKDRNDEAELVQLLWDNMFSDLDPATWGMD